ncbi:MAG: response regulator [Chlorobiaceae bacterium]|nr:response regulator [Chlorobiaceae bacterium]
MIEESFRNGKVVSCKIFKNNEATVNTIYPVRSFGGDITHFLLALTSHDRGKQARRDPGRNTLTALNKLYDAIPASILVIDSQMRLIGWNRFSREKINGRPDEKMSGINPFERVHPDDLLELVNRKFPNVLNNDVEETAEFRMFHKDGPPYKWATLRAKKAFIDGEACVIAVVTEITELKQAEEKQEILEEQLRQFQKMELIGQLAGGIAHDFNNALAAIIGNAELVLNKLGQSASFVDNIKDIHYIANQSAKLTRQLLAFARKQVVIPQIIDIKESITESLPLHHRLIGENIQFEWNPCNKDVTVLIDPTQLDQILSNLFINARDAITGNGKIMIDCDLVHFNKADCTCNRSALSPGEYVRLSIGDTGSGIDTKVLPHIYEPFFTTKEVGKGTGLGLSTVYGIVMQNNGHIECHTEPGKGTRFDMYLPRHRESKQETESEGQSPVFLNANHTILVVEDEPFILKLIRDILESHGFTVLTARDAEECISICQTCETSIELLITDIVLPTINGVQLGMRLLKENPSLKLLFMSAYSPEHISQDKELMEGVDFIQKPFGINDFMTAINRVMSST